MEKRPPLHGDDTGSGPPGNASQISEDIEIDDGHFEWMVREIESGRLVPPPESALEGPAVSISLGDASDVDPELFAALCAMHPLDTLSGFGGPALGAEFGQDEAADTLTPGPLLSALTSQVVSQPPAALTDDGLIGVLHATQRLANLAAYQQTVVIAEFARRRQAEFEAAKARGVPVGCRDGEFPGEELAMELVASGAYAGGRIDTAIELTTRLPVTLAGMAEGLIDLTRACVIATRTRSMTDADAAYADAVLAAVAPGLRIGQLARKAEALEKKLAPEAVKARKELARHLDQRVEARREESGNASLAGRELDPADVIASKAYIDAVAGQLRRSGLFDGPIGRIRALVLTDLTQGRDPLDRITPRPATATVQTGPAAPGAAAGIIGTPFVGHGNGEGELTDNSWRSAAHPADRAPLPALINLLVPAGTLLGWGTAPAQVAGWGLLDADEAKALVQVAAQHPRTRWCMTIIAPDGTAIAHGCAKGQRNPPDHPSRSSSRAPRVPNTPGNPGGTQAKGRDGTADDAKVPPSKAAQLLTLLRRLDITLDPIARDTCDHAHAENHYVPSRRLKHLIYARAQTCTAPACNAQAVYSDLDHTIPYPDGPTDECNLNPKCRRHHRTKQAPGWKVTQQTPDTATWITPSGRTHTTSPTSYDT